MTSRAAAFRGLATHFLLSLELNFRSKQAMVYGYLVPILFLVAFGSVFRAETPALLGQMGQLLTITILGGACFGMPTALVAERERGIWRRYRLLPVPTGSLVGSVLAARVLIVASAAALQVALAHLIYGTPLPLHPLQETLAVLLVTGSFLGLGLLVSALADDVPAVQALGQCLFLPMIMIGGVGIPLLALPSWAQRASGFMPGRYAVDMLQLGYGDPAAIWRGGFSALALLAIGSAAAVAGSRLFRWDAGKRVGGASRGWVAAALCAWIAVGLAAAATGRLAPSGPPSGGYAAVTEAEIDSITYDNLPGDSEFVSRLARPFAKVGGLGDMAAFAERLGAWPPGRTGDSGQDTRNLLCVAGIADVSEDPHEGEIARLVFDDLRARLGDERLSRVLAWIIRYPQEGSSVTSVPELGLGRQFREPIIRERTVLYARKFLGRLRGKISD
jgi:ABC-type transport system involved in cytochrome c biogenesis permease component